MLSIQPDPNLSNITSAPEPRSRKSRPYARESRITKDNRRIWYQLEVLQQPERARACGSGPKSSADRRPVDPPPVVILRVLDGETYETARDITFDYNVDFFCYASLEHARPISHGRVQTPAGSSIPVLTGFPVSGCCYLDRPDPAGYFLFPDLSVRHEGRYRLVFSLYELIKEKNDLDKDAPDSGVPLPAESCHRMDLKSAEFTVYSAKKFPGLTESTTLSRTVAEQGCRVRIRRDVRMRKRPALTKGVGEEYSDSRGEEEFEKGRGTHTPDVYRGRSASNSSMDRTNFQDRRPSHVEYPTAPPSSSYHSSRPPSALLNFGHATNGFAQPSYGPMSSSNPQSTPVSPAQCAFPQGPGANLPNPSHSYQGPGYPHPLYEQPEPERRPSCSYPLISSKPPRGAEPRSSLSSNMSMENNGQRPILPSISFPTPDSSPYMNRMEHAPNPMKGRLYPHIESRPVKRSADESFPSHQHERDINGVRLPMQQSPYTTSNPCYTRADGRTLSAPMDFWLS